MYTLDKGTLKNFWIIFQALLGVWGVAGCLMITLVHTYKYPTAKPVLPNKIYLVKKYLIDSADRI